MTAPLARRMLALAAVIGALALAGCAAQPGAGGSTEPGGSVAVDVVGVWGNPDVSSEPSLEFVAGGTVSGTDGCNQIGGSYTLEAGTVTFSDMISTLMACKDVDTWLSAADTATVEGDTMTVLDADGIEIGTLDRN